MAAQKGTGARHEGAGQGKMCCQNAGPVRMSHWQGVKHRHIRRSKGSAKVKGSFLLDPGFMAKKGDQVIAQQPGTGDSGHIVASSCGHMQKAKHPQEFFGQIRNPWPWVGPVDWLQRCQPVVRVMQRENTSRRAARKQVRALQVKVHPIPVRRDSIRQAVLSLRSYTEKDEGGAFL
jgi:hypothetical protein